MRGVSNTPNENCTEKVSGNKCIFPFTYNGARYNKCILERNSNSTGWCPTKIDPEENILPGHTGICSEYCSFEPEQVDSAWNVVTVVLVSVVVVLLLIIMILLVEKFLKYKKNNLHTRNFRNLKHVDESETPQPLKSSMKRQSIDSGDNRKEHGGIVVERKKCLSRQVSTASKVTISENVSVHPFPSEEEEDPNEFVHKLTRQMSLTDENEEVFLRKNIFQRQMTGDPQFINYTLSLNEQVKILPYNSKYEIKREFFTEKEILGSGNFGYVFLGEARSLFYPKSITPVAIKTMTDVADTDSVRALLCEIKIMSQIELDVNLVNMVACCSSQFVRTGEIWLLMEFCQLGDIKNFLIEHRSDLIRSENRKNSRGSWTPVKKLIEPVGNRVLVQWAYDIAMGMRYLARKHIMHGDLAARNILISAGEDGLVAKVCDFGLSKHFYDDISYKKTKRKYVPWKWMALEYLEDARFTMTSDVWSYGVVVWELFSLGKEPYPGKSYNEMLKLFKSGYRLPCPEEVQNIKSWSALEVYKKITEPCFIGDPLSRCTFSKIVDIIDTELTEEEKIRYEMLKGKYLALGKMRRGSIAALHRTAMTQTSIQEQEKTIQEFLNHHQKLSTSNEEVEAEAEAEEEIEMRPTRHNYRRLTSVF